MNIIKIENLEYKTYQKLINITLFNELIDLIIKTRNEKNTYNIWNEIHNKIIWNNRADCTNFLNEYNFKYLGEILERYEERIGNSIEDLRAIILAVGYGRNIIENNMIIGTQLIDFISKMEKIAENDIYIKGALYLYDSKKYEKYYMELFNKKYNETEEIIFALSIFYDQKEDFFKQHRNEVISLLGKERTINVIGNIGIFAWTIKLLYQLINKDRKKDIVVLKSLIKIPTGLKNGYTGLLNNGYNSEEISYLNYLMLFYNSVPNTTRLGNSIVEEKIAIELCKVFINSERVLEINVYNLIKKILQRYDKFDIKCYGYSGIKDAIKDELKITNPVTFGVLYNDLNQDLYEFNILESKWDIVAEKMEEKTYEEIFDKYLLNSKYEKEKINECINRYNKLTGKYYFNSFSKYEYKRQDIFAFLVNKNVLLLKDVFEEIMKNNNIEYNEYFKRYIKNVNNKKSFEFLKYILRTNKYNIKEINNLGFEFDEMFRSYGYWSQCLDIKRKFLNVKEQRLLFNCLEKYVFYYKPQYYFKFLEAALKDEVINKFYKKEKLRNLYKSLCKIDPRTYETEWFQKEYLTSEEVEAIQEQKRIEKENKIQAAILQNKMSVIEEFNKLEDKNKFKYLYEFCDQYEFSDSKIAFCMEKTKNYIMNNLANFSKEKCEVRYFIKLLDFFLKKEAISVEEFIKIMSQYIKEEGKVDEYNVETCKISN